MEKCGKTDVLHPETGRPLCKLHDEPMMWKKDARCDLAGSWVCHVRNRANNRRWGRANAKRKREYFRKWVRENPEKAYLQSVRRGIKRKRKQLEEAGSVSSGSKTG